MRTHIPFYLSKSGLLATFIAAAFSPYAFALTPAGKVDFAFGKATATGTDGATRPLAKGTEIYSGDAITTTDGRVQIRFTDGAFMALQPNTIFKVDQYAFDGKSDGKEKGSFNLVKGSLRTVTGLIGKVNKANYEVRTPTATIGIRGTAYSATQTDDGLVVSVAQGLVSVSNSGGNVTLSTGQSVLVKSSTSSPEMTDQKAQADQIVSDRKQQEETEQEVVTERPINTETVNAAGDQRSSTGVSLPIAPIAGTPADPVSGENYAVGTSVEYNQDVFGDTPANFSGTKLIGYTNNYPSTVPVAQVRDSGWDGTIGWGRWTGEVTSYEGESLFTNTYDENGGIHYFVGKPATNEALQARLGTTVRYDLVGATQPSTAFTPSGGGTTYSLGTLSSNAYASVNFGATANMTLNGTIDNSVANVHYNLANFGSIGIGGSGATPTFSASAGYTPSGSASQNLNLSGAFIGGSAERLGLAYSINSSSGGNSTVTSGSAAFAAGAVTPLVLPPVQ